jgi:hypothetical protein
MPGFDGTGPTGVGPLTGRGRGFCISPISRRGVFPYFYIFKRTAQFAGKKARRY